MSGKVYNTPIGDFEVQPWYIGYISIYYNKNVGIKYRLINNEWMVNKNDCVVIGPPIDLDPIIDAENKFSNLRKKIEEEECSITNLAQCLVEPRQVWKTTYDGRPAIYPTGGG